MSTTLSTKTTSVHDASHTRLNEGVVAALKDLRAHEHARHRTKERQEHALAKERKEKVAADRALGLKVSRSGGAKLVRRFSMESWDGETPEERLRSPLVDKPNVAPPTAIVHDDKQGGTSASELTLGDVISKPRRRKTKQLDFELIPPIRGVIALDDIDADTEEAWEYVTRASVNDGSAWKGKSYAQAAASAM